MDVSLLKEVVAVATSPCRRGGSLSTSLHRYRHNYLLLLICTLIIRATCPSNILYIKLVHTAKNDFGFLQKLRQRLPNHIHRHNHHCRHHHHWLLHKNNSNSSCGGKDVVTIRIIIIIQLHLFVQI